MILYQYELTNQVVSVDEIFENDTLNQLFDYKKTFGKNGSEVFKEQIKIMSIIEKNYSKIKQIISKYVREDWTWSRMNPIIRSVLLCAIVELKKLDLGIVTNEYVEITKDFLPNLDDYKFVNKIIQEIGRYFNENSARS